MLFANSFFLEDINALESEENIPSKRRKFDLKFKLEVIKYAALWQNNSKAAKDKGVERTTLIKWIKQEDKIKEQLKGKSSLRLFGAGRPLKDPAFDEKLLNWIQTQRKKKLRVSRKIIQIQAQMMSTDKEFKVSFKHKIVV